MILRPGYLRWDGVKYTTDSDIEIVGPAGPPGPSGASAATAGDGLFFSGGYNVGQNDDNSIVVNENDIQLKLSYQALLDEATDLSTGSTIALRNVEGKISLADEVGITTYGGSITIDTLNTFTLQQTVKSSNLSPANLTIISQYPYALATGSNRKPGDINLVLGTPTNGGTTEASVNIKKESTTLVSLTPFSGGGKIDYPNSGYINSGSTLTLESGTNLSLVSTNELSLNGGDILMLTSLNVCSIESSLSAININAGTNINITSTGSTIMNSEGLEVYSNGQNMYIDAAGGDISIDTLSTVTINTGAAGLLLGTSLVTFNNTSNGIIGFATDTDGGTGASLTIRGANVTGGGAVGGDTIIGGTTGATKNGNIGLGGNVSDGSGGRIIFIANATTVPSTNPTGGGILYVEAGALKYRGSSGTITPLASA